MTCKKALGYLIVSFPFVAIYAYGGYLIGFGPISILTGAGFAVGIIMAVGVRLINN